MIRALITAALLAGAAMQFFDAQPDVAIGYSLVVSLTLWFFWPLLRRIARLARRRRRRHQPAAPGSAGTAPHPDQSPPPLLRRGAPGGARDDAEPRLQPPGTAPARRGTKGARRDLRHHRH